MSNPTDTTQSSYPYSVAQPSGIDSAPDATSNGTAVHQPPLSDRLAQGAHHTIDRLAESAGPHIERMEEAVVGATQQLKGHVRQMCEMGDQWAFGLRATVRRNPLSAIVTALAVGALMARMMR